MNNKLKLGIFLLVSFLFVFLLASLLLPSAGTVTRTISIHQTKDKVVATLEDMDTYPSWFPWLKMDSASYPKLIKKASYSGFYFFEKDTEKRKGAYQLMDNQGDSILSFSLDYEGMPRVINTFDMYAESANSTALLWEMKIKPGWKLWWRLYAATLHKTMDPVIDSGLTWLRAYCEEE